MEFVLGVPVSGPLATPESLGVLARRAEELGFGVLSASERLVMPGDIRSRYPYGESGEVPGVGTSQNTLEMLSVLSFLAGQTSTIRLLTSVLVLPYRNPLIAAKTLATVDVLSDGRLIVGCGVGWMREECDVLGVPTPFEERGAVSDEYIRCFRELWASGPCTFQGDYFSFSDVTVAPMPVQRPHPPIWIGGESPAALRRAAALGDGWFPGASNPRFPLSKPEQLAASIDRLRRYAEDSGRDPSQIDVCFSGGPWTDSEGQVLADGRRRPFTGSHEQVASDIRQYEALGVTHLALGLGRPVLADFLERMERFAADVMPLAG